MQSAPAYEGMYLHGILHRVEGDYDNARAWYSDVKKAEIYKALWGSGGVTWKEWKESGGEKDEGQAFLDKVEKFIEVKRNDHKEALEEVSRREIESVIDFCVKKFGTEKMADASDAWVRHSSDIRQMSEDQVSGNSGRRKF